MVPGGRLQGVRSRGKQLCYPLRGVWLGLAQSGLAWLGSFGCIIFASLAVLAYQLAWLGLHFLQYFTSTLELETTRKLLNCLLGLL